MILVDTSVWIDFFGTKPSSSTDLLTSLITDNNQACICGMILQEILQGIKEDSHFNTIKSRLLALPFIDTDLDTYLIASSIYRKLKKKGYSLPTVDILLSAVAIQNRLLLFTLDKHFKMIAEITNLKLFNQ